MKSFAANTCYSFKFARSFILVLCLISICLAKENSQVQVLGKFPEILEEASGIAISNVDPNRLYHINDSGDTASFYISDRTLQNIKKIHIDAIQNWDFEDISTGKCLNNKDCLVIGDIGDNPQYREYIEIHIIEEQIQFAEKTPVLKSIKVKYPDRAHNAEALALHPSGDLFIITKEESSSIFKRKFTEAEIFKISKNDWESFNEKTQKFITPKLIGKINLPEINANEDQWGRIVTSMDIAKDGKSFLVLNYVNALHIQVDLSQIDYLKSEDLVENKNFQILKLKRQKMMEAICFDHKPNIILYSSEKRKSKIGELHSMSIKN